MSVGVSAQHQTKHQRENYILQEKVTSELATKISLVLQRTTFLFPFWKATGCSVALPQGRSEAPHHLDDNSRGKTH